MNLVLLPISFLTLYFAAKSYGNGLQVILAQNLAFDAGTFAFNKKKAFKNRGASTGASGGKSALIATVCFLYHKVLAILLSLACGMNAMEIKAALAGVGLAENPVLFVIRDQWVFTKDGLRESSAAFQRLEMARAAVAGHLLRLKTGV